MLLKHGTQQSLQIADKYFMEPNKEQAFVYSLLKLNQQLDAIVVF